MKITNITKKPFNLKSGVCNAGESAEVTTKEFQLLVSQNKAEIYTEPKPVVKPTVKKKAVSNG